MGRMRVAAVAVAAALSTFLSGCWVQPGFDAGHTRFNSAETAITTATVATLAPRWTVQVANGPLQEPLSVNGRVFAVGTESDGSHRAVRVDAATGDVAWSTPLPKADGFAVNDPVYLDGNVAVPYLSFTIGGVDVISAGTGAPVDVHINPSKANWALAVVDGELVTATRTFTTVRPFPFSYTVDGPCNASISGFVNDHPQPRQDFAYVGTDLMWDQGATARGFVDCNPATGQFRSQWQTPLAGEVTSVVAVGDDDVAYTDDTGTVTVLDSSSGTLNWALDVDAADAPTAWAAGTLFVTTTDGRVVALDGATGAQRWEAPVIGPAALAVGADVLYVAELDSGVVHAFARDGCGAPTCPELATVDAGGPVSAGPIVDGGLLVVGTGDGRVVAFGPEG